MKIEYHAPYGDFSHRELQLARGSAALFGTALLAAVAAGIALTSLYQGPIAYLGIGLIGAGGLGLIGAILGWDRWRKRIKSGEDAIAAKIPEDFIAQTFTDMGTERLKRPLLHNAVYCVLLQQASFQDVYLFSNEKDAARRYKGLM